MTISERNNVAFLNGGGEMGQMMRSKDWSTTPMGAPAAWPQSLQISISLLLNSQFPMFVWWGDDYVTFYNDAYRVILGDKHPQALGASGPVVWKEIWDVIGPMARRVREEGQSNWAEDQLLYINRHGFVEETYFTFSYSPVLDLEGKVGGVFCACTETTEKVLTNRQLKESETRFRNLANESPMFVFIIDVDPLAPVSYWNKTWLTYTGQTYEEALGRAWNGILHADDISVVMQYYAPAFDNKEPYFIPAVRVKRHDGEYRWYAFKGNPRYLASGAFNGYVGVGFDVHEQVMAEQALRKSEEELERKVRERTIALEQKNKELEQFTYAASHDMQEPLRKVATFSNFLIGRHSDQLDKQGRSYVEKIDASVKRMKTIIDDLLRYSHQEKVDQQFTPTDLNTIINEIKSDLDLVIEQRGAVIENSELPSVIGVPSQLHQLFYNLITNALKFSKPNVPPQIKVTAIPLSNKELTEAYNLDVNRTYVQIHVSDNGIGFNQEHALQIFDLFKRLHGRSEYEGTGIGLALCKKIAENHSGHIWAKSKSGKGTTFKVLLPLA